MYTEFRYINVQNVKKCNKEIARTHSILKLPWNEQRPKDQKKSIITIILWSVFLDLSLTMVRIKIAEKRVAPKLRPRIPRFGSQFCHGSLLDDLVPVTCFYKVVVVRKNGRKDNDVISCFGLLMKRRVEYN